jgi:hypothetical protein
MSNFGSLALEMNRADHRVVALNQRDQAGLVENIAFLGCLPPDVSQPSQDGARSPSPDGHDG